MTTTTETTTAHRFDFCESSTSKHPCGGHLTIRALTKVSCEIVDTRKFAGKRRRLVGVVYQAGLNGWKVIHNPGENHKVAGHSFASTAAAAWESFAG